MRIGWLGAVSLLALMAGCAGSQPAGDEAPNEVIEAAAQDAPGLYIGGKGAIVIGDALPPPLIDQTLRSQASAFSACRGAAGDGGAELAGRSVFKMVIGSDGQMKSVIIKPPGSSGAPLPEAVTGCMTTVLEKMSFPEPRGGVNVTTIFPFRFESLIPSAANPAEAEAMQAALMAERERVEICHGKAMDIDSTVAGEIAIKVIIGEGGSVASTEVVEDTTGSDMLASCLTDVVEGLSFAEGGPEAGAEAVLPFRFIKSEGP